MMMICIKFVEKNLKCFFFFFDNEEFEMLGCRQTYLTQFVIKVLERIVKILECPHDFEG